MEWMLYILSDQFLVKDASFENLLFLFKYLTMSPILNLGDLLMTRFLYSSCIDRGVCSIGVFPFHEIIRSIELLDGDSRECHWVIQGFI